jgi:leucyl aminopeptidase
MPAVGNAGVTQVILGLLDATYADTRYKKRPESGFPAHPLQALQLLRVPADVAKNAALTAVLSASIGAGVSLAKDLVGAPPNSKTPLVMAQVARDIAASSGGTITCQVLGAEECLALGMGAYLGVQSGSRY